MRKTCSAILIGFLLSSSAYAETIVLKSGTTVNGKILERTDKYVKIDFHGVPVKYNFEDVDTIDGITIIQKTQQGAQPEQYVRSLTTENYPLAEGNYWAYNEHVKIQDKNKQIKNIDFVATIKVVSCFTKGDFKVAKIEQNTFRGDVINFYYIMVDNKIYSVNDADLKIMAEKAIEEILNKKDVAKYCLLKYVFPMKKGLDWSESGAIPFNIGVKPDYIEGIEEVAVPAGKFTDTFKIKNQMAKVTEWFYPHVGVIKYEHHFNYDGSDFDRTAELKEYKIQ